MIVLPLRQNAVASTVVRYLSAVRIETVFKNFNVQCTFACCYISGSRRYQSYITKVAKASLNNRYQVIANKIKTYNTETFREKFMKPEQNLDSLLKSVKSMSVLALRQMKGYE